MTGPDPLGFQPPSHLPADGYPPPAQPVPPMMPPPMTPPGFPVQQAMPGMPPTGQLPAGQGYGPYPAPARKAPGRGLVITLAVLALVFLAGSVALGTMYLTSQSHLAQTTEQRDTTKNTLTATQGQLHQANDDNQSLTTQKNSLNTQITAMQPCAKSAKALADLLADDLNKNANPFLDQAIVNPMSNEIRDCQ